MTLETVQHSGHMFRADRLAAVAFGILLATVSGYVQTSIKRETTLSQLIYYNRLPKGGHFAAWEQPELFVAELRTSFKSLR